MRAPPPQPHPSPPPPSPEISTYHDLISTLNYDRNLLHLLVHKSKNQHRHSLWFKWLRMLKRFVERVILHLQTTTIIKPDDKISYFKPKLHGDNTFISMIS